MSEKSYAPIVLFVYNRPEHVCQTVESLKKNHCANESDLFIYSDGSKDDDLPEAKVAEVRSYVKTVTGFKKITIVESAKNKGLANSIIDGVTEVVNRYGKVIVLEDDLITSPYFLPYMNECLQRYNCTSNVYSISAHMFNVETELRKIVLLPYIATWGWATWKNKWNTCDWGEIKPNSISSNKYLKQRFNLAEYDYFSQLLINKRNAWGIRWYYNLFLRNGLSVYPTKTLVKNIGLDGSGTNCKTSSSEVVLADYIKVEFQEKMDLYFYGKVLDFFSRQEKNKNGTIFNKIWRYIK